MKFVFKFTFELHLNFLFHFILSENLRLLVCKVLGQKSNLFCKLTLLPQSLVKLQFAFQSSFWWFTGHCKQQSKHNVIFLSHKTRKENHQQLKMKQHVANATMSGIFAQTRGFQIHAKIVVADFSRQSYYNENSLPFWTNSFQKGIRCCVWRYSVKAAEMLWRLIVA